MNKRDSSGDSDKHDKVAGKQVEKPVYLQRVFDSLPAQIDAIKAKREREAKELRRFVRRLEEDD